MQKYIDTSINNFLKLSGYLLNSLFVLTWMIFVLVLELEYGSDFWNNITYGILQPKDDGNIYLNVLFDIIYGIVFAYVFYRSWRSYFFTSINWRKRIFLTLLAAALLVAYCEYLFYLPDFITKLAPEHLSQPTAFWYRGHRW